MKTKVLILDGDHNNALAIVRNFGLSKKYIIDVVAYSKFALCFFSKFTNNKFIIPHPKENEENFLTEIIKILKENKYATIIPVSYLSFQILSKNIKSIKKYTNLTITSYQNILSASNKIETYKIAEKLKIPYPKTYYIETPNEINNLSIKYPCVIKAPLEMGKNLVEYARNFSELKKKYHKILSSYKFKEAQPIIQEYIKGEGAGFFAFYKKGKLINWFIHKRIREYPVSGGASTVAKSYYNEKIFENGKKILDYLGWEGVAMVEFKKDNASGTYKLMEINAKFWGSLELAISAGVNFPEMLVLDALNLDIPQIRKYQNVKFQWILSGDIFHIIEKPSHFPDFIKDLFSSKNDIMLSDLKPNLFQLLYIPVYYFKKGFKR